MKKRILILISLLVIILIVICYSRVSTAFSIERVSDYDDYNLYEMDVRYSYDLDRIISNCAASDESYISAVLNEVLPFVKVEIATPDFACSSFNMLNSRNSHCKMGRNYDFEPGTSSILVRCHPDNGYSSIAMAPLYNVKITSPDSTLLNRLISLTFPFACVDGINEKGVSISVLSLDGKPTRQNRGKPILYTTMAVRLVLDRAASTAEAVEILSRYDMFAGANVDYHFYINDSNGEGVVVEFNPEKENRDMVAIKSHAVTNFYIMYRDSIQPCHTDKIFTHGRDRYNAIDSIFSAHADNISDAIGWEALKRVSRGSRASEQNYKTQWSALYDNTACNVSVVINRDWNSIYRFYISR